MDRERVGAWLAGSRRVVQPVRDRWSSFSPLLATRRAAAGLFLLAFGVFWIEEIAWPVDRGRDSLEYMTYYIEMWKPHTVVRGLMALRTPLPGIVVGLPFQLGGVVLVEIVLGCLFALSVLAWSAIGLSFGRLAGLLTALCMLAYPPYGVLFHDVGPDGTFAFCIALWCFAAVRTARAPATWKFLALGLGVVLVGLARPPGFALLAFAPVPLLLAGSVRSRFRWFVAFAGATGICLLGWAGYNSLRYADFTLSRQGAAWVPFYPAFTSGRVSPNNGPASRELASAVQRLILTQPGYRRAHETVQTYFSHSASFYEFVNLLGLSDAVWGWDSGYRILHQVAAETPHRATAQGSALRRVRKTLDGVWRMLRVQSFRSPSEKRPPESGKPPLVIVAKDGLRIANKEALGTPWFAASYGWVGCPSIYIDRCLVTGQSRIWDASQIRQYRSMVRELESWDNQLPPRNGSTWLAQELNNVTFYLPRVPVWIGIALVFLLLRRPRGMLMLLTLSLLALVILAVHVYTNVFVVGYAVPVFPAFIVLLTASLAGQRRPWLAGGSHWLPAWLPPARARREPPA
ncbi:MAG: hypothetical protein ACXVZ1_05895 [Gaiellaceae bacterium]